ncbi:putative chromatin regulator PHD family [Helianthus annuus]|uniref:Chromatin regulator PHD family n=3 Tax=Helianthus annuus TaxID=4232 RepID=A0A9K3GY97_HELAN|nr:putative chromatin regulator PHD family [Helianthus annuus]
MMFEHEHPFSLIDLWSEQVQREAESEEDEEEKDDVLIAKQDFKCLCSRCGEEINRYHRYYYSCCHCSDYSVHKFCAELPPSLEDICDVGHTLDFIQSMNWMGDWNCKICGRYHKYGDLWYRCDRCYFQVDVSCGTKMLQKNIIHHPSHKHPLICISKQLLAKCDACGKEHKGNFYHCSMCVRSNFIHSHCAFLPQKLPIQDTTNDVFSHIHHLTLAYSFPIHDQRSKDFPRCRVCRQFFDDPNLWIYKCEKCRYYTHLDCATSRDEPFMSILKSPGTDSKNYKDDEHLDLLHLPFPDPSYSILKHLFSKEKGLSTLEISNKITYKAQGVIHKHPLILEDITIPTSSRIKSISYHDPMKRIQLLCDGCVRPITSGPIYVSDNEGQCNFMLHEWCSRLPAKLIDHPAHQQHTLILRSKAPPRKFFGVFDCDICELPCNGFAYYCKHCYKFIIDVECAFLPKEITHTIHPNHLLSRVYHNDPGEECRMCGVIFTGISFDCHTCNDFRLHAKCALFIPETTRNKCDKHPMKLSYFPIENHKSDYICEVCERELNPEMPFYHCHECMQSMHTTCAPSILQYETYDRYRRGVYQFVNVKFGGRYENSKVHPHPLSFVQGIQDDGQCHKCGYKLQFKMIFKCLTCEFAVDYDCCSDI